MINRIVCVAMILLFGCTTLSKNTVRHGSYVLRGGVSPEKVWRDGLEFKKISWYQEFTLLYDVLLAKVDSKTPFNNWFSSSTRDLVKSCGEFYLVLSYAQNAAKISNWMFFKEMRENGFRKVAIETFYRNLVLHPEWENQGLAHYEIAGLCRMEKSSQDIVVSFPGYMKTKL